MRRTLTLPPSAPSRVSWVLLAVGAAFGVLAGAWLVVTSRPTLFAPSLFPGEDGTRAARGWAERMQLVPSLSATPRRYVARPFDAKEWKRASADSDDRYLMVKDLLERRLPTGSSKSEVLDLLGTPSRRSTSETWVYVLGPCGLLGVGERQLHLYFDSRGGLLITSVRCTEY